MIHATVQSKEANRVTGAYESTFIGTFFCFKLIENDNLW